MKNSPKRISVILVSFMLIFLFYSCSDGVENNLKEIEPRIYSVIFNPNGGNILTVSQDIEENKVTALMKTEMLGLSYVGKKFIGWGLTSKDETPTYLDGAEIRLNKNITLYALWANKETINISCPNTTITIGEQIEFIISLENFTTNPSKVTVYAENNLNAIAENISIVNNKFSISSNEWNTGSYKLFVKAGNTESNHIAITINEQQIGLPKKITISSKYSLVNKGDFVEFSIDFENFQTPPTTIDIYNEGQEKAIATEVSISNGKFLLSTDNYDVKDYQLYVKKGNMESNRIEIEIISNEITEKKIILTSKETSISIGDDLSLSVSFENFTTHPTTLDVYMVGNDDAIVTGITVANGKLSVPTTSFTVGKVSLYVKSKNSKSNIIFITAKEKNISLSSTKTTLYSYETLTLSIEFNNFLSEPTSTSIYIDDKYDAIATDVVILDGKISVSASEFEVGEHSIYLKNGNIESNRLSIIIIGKTINISTANSIIINNTIELNVAFDGFQENPTVIDLLYKDNATTNLSISDGKISISTEDWGIGTHSIYVKSGTIASNTIIITNAAKLNDDGSYTVTADTIEAALNTIESSKATIKVQDSLTSILSIGESVRNSLVSIDLDLSEVTDLQTISRYCFDDCTKLTSILLPNSIITIGQGAFVGCTNLTNITIPESVTTIEKHAFSDCTRLTNIVIPSSVESIGEEAFYNCLSFKSITLPFVGGSADINRKSSSAKNRFGYIFGSSSKTGYIKVDYGNVFYIPASLKDVTITGGKLIDGEFGNCSNLRTIIISGVKQIGSNVFEGCSNLTSISLPSGITSIGNSAFNGCINLTSINLPASITTIGEYAFQNCSNLTNLVIPDSVTEISQRAFQSCGITNITLSSSLLTIPEYTFENCSKLKEISIPDSIISIGSFAFNGCSGLTSIIVPESVTSIGENAFADCFNLEEISLPFIGENNSDSFIFASIFNKQDKQNNDSRLLYTNSYMDYYYYIPKTLKKVTITNDKVTNIDSMAFYGCSSLTTIILPNNLTDIGVQAFCECSSLSDINIPDSVEHIGSSAFHNCNNLLKITIPNKVNTISLDTFSGCTKLKEVYIPNSITSIEDWAFQACYSLTSITIPNSVKKIGNYVFADCYSLEEMSLPFIGNYYDGSNALNQSITSNYFASIFNKTKSNYLDNESRLIKTCFDNNNVKYYIPKSLKKITITGMDIEVINSIAFLGCSNLVSITLPDNIKIIGSDAFSNCQNLVDINIPDGVITIEESAFYNCTNLTTITIPDSVTSIGRYAFYNCTNLKYVSIPDSVTTIGENAFASD